MSKSVIRNCEKYDKIGSIETCVEDGFTMTAVGDLIVSRVMTKGKLHGFDEVVKLLQSTGADVTFGNFEGSIFDIRHFHGSPQAEYGGAYHVSVPAVAVDLRKMGFDLMSHANNHTMDWGAEGMRETQRYLEEAGIVYSGSGENLAEASAARFLETPRGRVGLVSLSTTFPPLFRAADPVREAPGRPGVCAARVNHYVTVLPEMLDTLRKIRNALSFRPPVDDSSDTVVLAANFASTVCKAGERIESCYSTPPPSRRNTHGTLPTPSLMPARTPMWATVRTGSVESRFTRAALSFTVWATSLWTTSEHRWEWICLKSRGETLSPQQMRR